MYIAWLNIVAADPYLLLTDPAPAPDLTPFFSERSFLIEFPIKNILRKEFNSFKIFKLCLMNKIKFLTRKFCV